MVKGGSVVVVEEDGGSGWDKGVRTPLLGSGVKRGVEDVIYST